MHSPPIRSAGRFAPTPTGSLHIGNAYTALLAHVSAHASQYQSILRIDDLDLRSFSTAYIQEQMDDLEWLGIPYDESPRQPASAAPYLQSLRQDLYQQALQELNQQGLLYPCFCSRKEIAQAVYAPHAHQEGIVYPGTCRPTQAQPMDLENIPVRNNRVATIRFNVHEMVARRGHHLVHFQDLVAGSQSFDLIHAIGDFVLRRRDHIYAYQLACAVDDYMQGCRLVLRGRDLLPSTARQLILLEALIHDNQLLPQYAHIGLLTSAQGERLAKRDQSLQIKSLRQQGVDPAQVRYHLARLWGGTSHTMADLIHHFDWHHVPARDLAYPEIFDLGF